MIELNFLVTYEIMQSFYYAYPPRVSRQEFRHELAIPHVQYLWTIKTL